MKFIIFPMLLLFIINSPPFKNINIEEIIEQRIEQEKKFQKKRNLNNGVEAYKNVESNVTLYDDCFKEAISLNITAEGGSLTEVDIPAFNVILEIISFELKMFDDKGREIPINSSINNCSYDTSHLKIKTNL